MTVDIGHGKIILFGEHFVVYGTPAIALGISNKAIVEVKKSNITKYASDTKGTIPELTTSAIERILTAMKSKHKYEVHLSGDLPTTGGLGSSAAFCVALVRAVAKDAGLSLRDEELNGFAYEGEKAFHGNPSGVDNTMATYGGAIKFMRDKGFERLKLAVPLHFVVGITGISSPTRKMVGQVKTFRDDDPEQFQNLCDQAGEIVRKGEKALSSGDAATLGALMNENHELLRAIGVSIEKNDIITKIALDNGALGAKVTGGGGGGCCIALAKNAAGADKILNAIKQAGFEGFITSAASDK